MVKLTERVAEVDAQRVLSENVRDAKTDARLNIQYQCVKLVGNGSFGVVFQIRLVESGRDAAIKRVLQDKRFKVCDALSELILEPGVTDHEVDLAS
jgi:hypothetical protein